MLRLRQVRLAGGPFDGHEVTVECGIAFVAHIRGEVRAALTPEDLDAVDRPRGSECYSPDLRPDSDPTVFLWRPRRPQPGLPD